MRIELELDGDDALALLRWLECAGMTKTVVSVMKQIEEQREDGDSRGENADQSEENN